MQTTLRTDGAPIDLRGKFGPLRARTTRRLLTLLLALPAAACGDSLLAPLEEQVTFESAAEIEAFRPAIQDLRERVLPSSRDPVWTARTMADLSRLETALESRHGFEAESAYSALVDDLNSCRVDRCLSAPDRTVLEITLEYARNLFGWYAT
jgi:hypothetical protein